MFRLVGETYVEFDFYRCYLLGLRGVVVSPQLGNQVTGVLSSVDSKGLGNNQQRLGEVSNGELLSAGERSSKVFQIDGEGGLNTSASNTNRFALQDSLDNAESIVNRAPQLVTVEVIWSSKDDGAGYPGP